MTKAVKDGWEAEATAQLMQALAAIDDPKKMQQFLRDLMTPKEIQEVSTRLEAAKMLQDGATYAQVIAKTKLSSRTVARTSNWLHNGTGGFLAALKLLRAKR